MDKVIIMISALFSAGLVMSLVLSKVFTKKWVGYIPSMMGIIVIMYSILKIYAEEMEGHVELGYNIRIYMVSIVIAGNLLTNYLIIRKERV